MKTPAARLTEAIDVLQPSSNRFSVGVDAVSLPRFRKHLKHAGSRFLARVLVEEEIRDCHGRTESLAARFAAKEAALKALGTGTQGVSWHNVIVESDDLGAPRIRLMGSAAARADTLGLNYWALSLTHDGDYAFAVVLARSVLDEA